MGSRLRDVRANLSEESRVGGPGWDRAKPQSFSVTGLGVGAP